MITDAFMNLKWKCENNFFIHHFSRLIRVTLKHKLKKIVLEAADLSEIL